MRYLFFLAALSLPILDIASLIAVGDRIGLWPTVAAVLLSGVLGSILVRSQGLAIIQQMQNALRSGRFPAREVFDGACVLIGGALLLLPGFLSDALGLLLLTPPVRGVMLLLFGNLARRSGRFHVFTTGPERPRSADEAGPVIEGEFRPIEEAPSRLVPPPTTGNGDDRHGASPWRPRPATVVPPEDP